jgi:hypothetical protein
MELWFGKFSQPEEEMPPEKEIHTNGTKKGINYIRRIPNWILIK